MALSPALWVVASVSFCPLHAQAPDSRVAALQRAAKLIDNHDLAGAEAALRSLVSAHDPLALNLLGVVRLEQGQKQTAEQLFLDASQRAPHLAGPHVNLAMLYGPERASESIAQFAEALKLSPADAQIQTALRSVAEKAALQAARSGDKKRALTLMLQARAALPHDSELLYQFGLVAMDAGQFADARDALQEALRLRPDYPEAIYGLARAYLGDGKGQEAEAQLRRYLALRPNDATAQYGLGYVLISEQKLDEARGALERSLALQPNQTESVFQLGVLDAQAGNRDAAAKRFAQVLSQDPRHAGALTETAILAFRDRKYDDAAGLLQRAIESAPGYEKAHYYLALTLARLGRKEESQREFRIATSLKKSPVSERLAAIPQ